MDGNALTHLANLLKQEEEQEEEEELDVSPYSATPGTIGPMESLPNTALQKQNKDIWSTGEVAEGGEHDYDDPREEPQYEMLFKQTVGSEDLFLGMGNKTPLTSSCSDLVVKIKLPATALKDIDLVVTETFLDCRTPKFRLGLHLPHTVASDSCRAKWQEAKNVLEVVLKLVREYDFVNH